MRKVKDVTRLIGVVERAGIYSPSNDRSEAKMRQVYEREVGAPASGSLTLSAGGLETFREIARVHGYKVIVIKRGLNR